MNETTATRDAKRPHGHQTILYVEDEPAVREFVQKVLTRHGYAVHSFGEPRQAIEFAKNHPRTIDLVFSDVMLPGMTGPAMAAELRRLHPESRVLFASGYTDQAIVQRGIVQPGVPLIQKPFTADALINRVRKVLDANPKS